VLRPVFVYMTITSYLRHHLQVYVVDLQRVTRRVTRSDTRLSRFEPQELAYKCRVDDPQSRRSLADDPTFIDRLSDLDRGLTGEDDQDVARDPTPPRRPARPAPRVAAPPHAPAPAPAAGAAPLRRTTSSSHPTASPRPGTPSERPPTNPQGASTTPQQSPSRPAPIAAFPAPPGPSPPGGSPRRRALIDLFPPAPREVARPPDPLLGMSAGPRLPRTRPVPVPAAPVSPQDELTYETFYGLHEKPFSLSPDPKVVYHSTSHDRAAQKMLDSIRHHGGLVVVTGESGIGKTTLCRSVIDQLDRRTLTSFLSDPSVSVEDLLKTVLVDVGVISSEDLARGPLMQASRQELTDTLRSFLGSLAALQASAVVIMDDAHNLSLDVLDEIRALVDFDGASRVVQIVLVGQPHLVSTLERSELKPLAQRITHRVELGPLLADEIAGYVTHRLAIAGTSPRVEFDDGALARVFELSRGVPRLVNLICDRALALGHELSASVIDEDLVDAAAEEIEVGPADSKARRLLRFVAAAIVLTLLMLVGAMAAAFVFRSQLSRAIIQWEAIPQVPGGPVPRVPAPLAPIPQPPS